MSRLLKSIAVATMFFAGHAAAQSTVSVPDNLKPAGETLSMVVPAKGVQIYECRVKKDGSGFEWGFVGPEANLYNARGTVIGKHYGGPHWESNDGSKVIASVKDRADAPAANAIPWLLLTSKSVGPQGAFSEVSSIQRVNTVGGIAPEGGCVQAGTTARVDYTADYLFFKRN